ncbi:melanocortin receptor 4-like [Crassostrea angulata]|uniref:melanocortin receptor 4-like n=1 Tax=Magallana angulata TaxID=2784310 RepID=UPI0022B1561F|nr:melanocortin receptor 4-like [Crassostrea angulata]
MIDITTSATDNLDDNISKIIQRGFRNNVTSKGLTLQLDYIDTTFDITFTCVIFTVAFFGCIGNLVTIGKIVLDPIYHTPTFAVIGQLALADFLSVTIAAFVRMTNIMNICNTCSHFVFIVNTSALISYSHLCFLSIVRYLITVHPLQSRQHLTVTAVCSCSLTIWIFCGVFEALLTYTTENWIYTIKLSLIVNVFVLLIVCSIITLLHVKKIRTLRNSLSVTDHSQRRMNIVVTVIIGIFVLYRLIWMAIGIIVLICFQEFSDELYYQTEGLFYFSIFIECINFSCNPYILFLSQFICS